MAKDELDVVLFEPVLGWRQGRGLGGGSWLNSRAAPGPGSVLQLQWQVHADISLWEMYSGWNANSENLKVIEPWAAGPKPNALAAPDDGDL